MHQLPEIVLLISKPSRICHTAVVTNGMFGRELLSLSRHCGQNAQALTLDSHRRLVLPPVLSSKAPTEEEVDHVCDVPVVCCCLLFHESLLISKLASRQRPPVPQRLGDWLAYKSSSSSDSMRCSIACKRLNYSLVLRLKLGAVNTT